MTPTYAEASAWFTPTRAARFESKIEKTPEGCWLWRGSLTESGHGQVDVNGHIVRVHRLTWLLARKRDIPEYIQTRDGFVPLVIRHLLCDHKNCCNPAHLVGGSQTENVEDTWMIHLAYKRDTERRAREEYSEHPYIGELSELKEIPNPRRAERCDEHWLGSPVQCLALPPASPQQSIPTQ